MVVPSFYPYLGRVLYYVHKVIMTRKTAHVHLVLSRNPYFSFLKMKFLGEKLDGSLF